MTRDDITNLAREAGGTDITSHDWTSWVGTQSTEFLERFATLVAAALRDEMWEKAMKLVAEAAAAEREACAKVVENYALGYAEPVWALKLTAAIRARGQA